MTVLADERIDRQPVGMTQPGQSFVPPSGVLIPCSQHLTPVSCAEQLFTTRLTRGVSIFRLTGFDQIAKSGQSNTGGVRERPWLSPTIEILKLRSVRLHLAVYTKCACAA